MLADGSRTPFIRLPVLLFTVPDRLAGKNIPAIRNSPSLNQLHDALGTLLWFVCGGVSVFLQVFDDQLLVAVEPTGQAYEQDLQSVHRPMLPNVLLIRVSAAGHPDRRSLHQP